MEQDIQTDTDPLEGTDVAWRFDSRSDEEDWSQVLYSVSGPSGEDEYSPPEHKQEDQGLSGEAVTWIIRIGTVGYFAFFVGRIITDEEIRLHMMHFSIRMLQSAARLLGGWALKTEKSYNEYVNTLH